MRKHFSATFVAQLFAFQFGHIVEQQFTLISKKNQHAQCCISVALQNNVLDSIDIKWPVKVEDLKLIVQNGKKTLERKNSVERIKRYCLKQVQVQVF